MEQESSKGNNAENMEMEMQKVNTQIWSEWLPSLQGYTLAGNYSLEFYLPPANDPAETVSYICIPLKKI